MPGQVECTIPSSAEREARERREREDREEREREARERRELEARERREREVEAREREARERREREVEARERDEYERRRYETSGPKFTKTEIKTLSRHVVEKSVEVAAEKLAKVIARVAGAMATEGISEMIPLLTEKLEASLANNTACETINEWNCNELGWTLLVVQLTKTITQHERGFLCIKTSSFRMDVKGVVKYLRAADKYSYESLLDAVSKKAIGDLNDLDRWGG
jgi:hypothetical protein